MKNFIKTLSIFCITISLISCNTDDDSGSETTGDLVGDYEMVSFSYEGTTTTTLEGQSAEADFSGIGQNIDYTIEFTENPNEFATAGSYDIELSTTVAGQTTTMVQPINDASSNGTYTRTGNTLTLEGTLLSTGNTIGGNATAGEATISELTDTTLILVQETSQEQTINGATISISLTAESVFTRI